VLVARGERNRARWWLARLETGRTPRWLRDVTGAGGDARGFALGPSGELAVVARGLGPRLEAETLVLGRNGVVRWRRRTAAKGDLDPTAVAVGAGGAVFIAGAIGGAPGNLGVRGESEAFVAAFDVNGRPR
jgi:hypothetical protein